MKQKASVLLCVLILLTKIKNTRLQNFGIIPPGIRRKRTYLDSLSTKRITRRRDVHQLLAILKKNTDGHDIYLNRKDGTEVRVRSEFFHTTLNVGEDTFKRWTQPDEDTEYNGIFSSSDELDSNVDSSDVMENTVEKKGTREG